MQVSSDRILCPPCHSWAISVFRCIPSRLRTCAAVSCSQGGYPEYTPSDPNSFRMFSRMLTTEPTQTKYERKLWGAQTLRFGMLLTHQTDIPFGAQTGAFLV